MDSTVRFCDLRKGQMIEHNQRCIKYIIEETHENSEIIKIHLSTSFTDERAIKTFSCRDKIENKGFKLVSRKSKMEWINE